MNQTAAHSSSLRTAHVVFGTSLGLGWMLHSIWPLTITLLEDSIWQHLIGAPLLMLGAYLIMQSKQELLRFGQPSEPKVATTKIVNSGLYQYSRNPAYLGISLCFAGLGIAINLPWLLLLLLPTLLVTQYGLIKPEERYLQQKFGDLFLHYRRSVRRWL